MFDRVTAVAQNSRTTIDVGNRRLARCCVRKTGVEADYVAVGEQAGDAQAIITDGGAGARENDLLFPDDKHTVGSSVDRFHFCLGHEDSLTRWAMRSHASTQVGRMRKSAFVLNESLHCDHNHHLGRKSVISVTLYAVVRPVKH